MPSMGALRRGVIYLDVTEFNELVRNSISNADSLIMLVKDAEEKLFTTCDSLKYRPPGAVEILDYETLYAIGDLHGDYATLVEFLINENILGRIETENLKIIFLGDYVDRGPQQLEVLASVLRLKTMYPDKVIVLRGNHEPPKMLIPVPHDFEDILAFKYGEEFKKVFPVIYRFFQRIPYVARVPGRFLFLHGGPPRTVISSKSYEEAFSIGMPLPDDIVLEDILWSDPVDDTNIETAESMRGAGVLYGPKVTERTLELSGTKYIIRGHEPAEGFMLNHGGRIVTLFDARIPTYGISRAAYLRIEQGAPLDDIRNYIQLMS